MKARVIKTGEIIDVIPQTNPNAVSDTSHFKGRSHGTAPR